MLQPHTHCYALRLHLNFFFSQIPINISGRMSCSKNYGTEKLLVIGSAAHHTVALNNKACHLRLEVNFATTSDDGAAHGLYHLGQTVGANMRMGIGQDGC